MTVGRFQAEVLGALAEDLPAEDVVARARRHAPDEAVRAWIEGWAPDLVDLAGVLVRTWAHRPE